RGDGWRVRRSPPPSPHHRVTPSPNAILLRRLNADDAPALAVILEFHAAGDLREDRVDLADARVQPRAEATSALADDDRAAGHDVAVVGFHAEPLRVGVAAVA